MCFQTNLYWWFVAEIGTVPYFLRNFKEMSLQDCEDMAQTFTKYEKEVAKI